jgi:hypothetical protein
MQNYRFNDNFLRVLIATMPPSFSNPRKRYSGHGITDPQKNLNLKEF